MSITDGLQFSLKYGLRILRGNRCSADYYADIGEDVIPAMHRRFKDRPEEYWLNLGYWKGARTYADACKGLAHLVATTAECGRGQKILDVGCGFGEQDLYLHSTFNPESICAIDITPLHVDVAQRRAAAMGLADKVQFRLGSATRLEFPENSFDRVVAVDCAYHFHTREDFFREAYRVLKPGGILAVSDMLRLHSERSNGPFQRLGRRFIYVPRENMYDRSVYAQKLRDNGFKVVEIEPIGKYVFSGMHQYFMKRIFNRKLTPKDVVVALSDGQFDKSRAHGLWHWCYGMSDYIVAKAVKGQ